MNEANETNETPAEDSPDLENAASPFLIKWIKQEFVAWSHHSQHHPFEEGRLQTILMMTALMGEQEFDEPTRAIIGQVRQDYDRMQAILVRWLTLELAAAAQNPPAITDAEEMGRLHALAGLYGIIGAPEDSPQLQALGSRLENWPPLLELDAKFDFENRTIRTTSNNT